MDGARTSCGTSALARSLASHTTDRGRVSHDIGGGIGQWGAGVLLFGRTVGIEAVVVVKSMDGEKVRGGWMASAMAKMQSSNRGRISNGRPRDL